MPPERLQKIISAAGVASRRKAEELISQGRVTVNGQTITEMGSKADPERDHIKVDGKLLRGPERHVYLLLNKPKGYVTTVSDPEGRPTVMSLVGDVGARVYPVGRLDYGSEGLLLLTNDGELANKLTRAASHVPKTYLVKISGRASEEDIDKLRHGVRIGSRPGPRRLEPVRTAPAEIQIFKDAENPWYEVTLVEGRNRQIRRMFEEIGHYVEKIKRVRYGPLTLDVDPGKSRQLTEKEVDELRRFDGRRQSKPFHSGKPRPKSTTEARRRGENQKDGPRINANARELKTTGKENRRELRREPGHRNTKRKFANRRGA